MIVREFGACNNETVILLHGGGLSWWSYQKAADLFVKNHYHVALPILDGHAGSDRHFHSIESNAAEIIAYIDQHFGGHVKLLAGLSLGAQVLLEILAQKKDVCDYAVIESALAIPMRITNALLSPSVALSFPLMKKPWFARLQFRFLNLPPDLYNDYYRDTASIRKEDMRAFLKSSALYEAKRSLKDTSSAVLIMVGGKESLKMRLSAKKLSALLPGSSFIVFDGWGHGEASIRYPERYVSTVQKFMACEYPAHPF